MNKKIEKILTSKYEVYCDTFDTKLKAEMHTVKPDGESTEYAKVLLTIQDKENKIQLSLWREDAQMFSDFMTYLSSKLDPKL